MAPFTRIVHRPLRPPSPIGLPPHIRNTHRPLDEIYLALPLPHQVLDPLEALPGHAHVLSERVHHHVSVGLFHCPHAPSK